ncbi:MAG: hypothetical protein RLZZ630_1314, partial [Bacteroidota bacterium]
MMKYALIIALAFGSISNMLAQSTILPQGSIWKYYDKGNLNTSWRSVTYNDATWKSGAAQLGYGDGDETTVVSYGTNAAKKYLTTYFRKTVSISNPTAFRNFTLNLKRDDGAVVYVNGTERFRTNMPTGSISGNTKASTAASDDGNTWQTVSLASTFFVNGNNVIGVEIHQFSTSDPDISFDLQLIANPNQPPVANAGTDQSVTLPMKFASLNGGASADPDGSISSYAWNQIGGPSTSAIGTPSSSTTTVSNLVQGTYLYRLTVTDNNGGSSADTVALVVHPAPNQAPIANAGSDQSITLPLNFTILDGSYSSDPDGTISVYNWNQIAGPSSSVIGTPTASSTTVNDLAEGTYLFSLTVTDNNGSSSSDTVAVAVNPVSNQAPVANAGSDQIITLPQSSSTLDGSASSDSDGTIATYAWNQVSGPNTSTIDNSSSAITAINNLVQGTYQYTLAVTDNNGSNSTDTITVQVSPAFNQPPTASAGADQTITLPQSSVTLDGGGSTDPDGSIASYQWTQLSGPGTATISSPTSASTAINGLAQGSYVFRLSVTDDGGATATDDVSVSVNPMTVLNAIPFGSVWNYYDSVVTALTNWNGTGFNDAAWKSGPAQLGYGDGDEATIVSYGPSSTSK